MEEVALRLCLGSSVQNYLSISSKMKDSKTKALGLSEIIMNEDELERGIQFALANPILEADFR